MGQPIAERYVAAAELLADMHVRRWPDDIEIAPDVIYTVPPFDRDAMLIEAGLLVNWYLPAMTGRPAARPSKRTFEPHGMRCSTVLPQPRRP